MSQHLVIAIDGPVGSGKSTVARALAAQLGIGYLDTGAMYRAVTLKALRTGTDMEDPSAWTRLAASCDIRLESAPDRTRVFLDGEDVTDAIRSLEVTNNAFRPSQTPGVRKRMVELQRLAAARGPLVAEGRDMGTVVFPDSPAKFYLDASVDERAKRRHRDHVARGDSISIDELKHQLLLRDQRDSARLVSPLRRADDAIYVDSTNMSVDEVVEHMISALSAKGLLGER